MARCDECDREVGAATLYRMSEAAGEGNLRVCRRCWLRALALAEAFKRRWRERHPEGLEAR